jgi:hypothetical protein
LWRVVSCPRLATVACGVFPCPRLATNAGADSRLRLQLCRLCRLAYSTNCIPQITNSLKVTLRPTTSRSVRLGFGPHLGLMTRC